MKSISRAAVIVILVAVMPTGWPRAADAQINPQGTPTSSARTTASDPIAPGRLVLKGREGVSDDDLRKILRDQGLTEQKPRRPGGTRVVQTPVGHERETIGRLSRQAAVEWVEPDYVVQASAGPATPSDPLYSSAQWDTSKIDMPNAWGITVGDNALRVAVIDTGIDMSHPDLATQWSYAPGHSASDHVFITTQISPGCSLPSTPTDDNGHGSHVSGIIAAASTLVGAPSVGMAGIAPGIRILPLKALDCQGKGFMSDVADAINFAVQNGASVINLSLGAPLGSCPTYVQSALTGATARGVLIAAAVGNEGSSTVSYPAGCAGVVGVAATDSSDQHPSFSNQNTSVVLSAPGVNITSAWNDDGYRMASGTSMASPHVAACAALVKSARPSLSSQAIQQMLQSTALDLGSTGFDTTFGWGRLDCGAAVLSAVNQRQTPASTPVSTPPAGPGSLGGKGLTIVSTSGGAQLSWQGGTLQTGFAVGRWSGSTLTNFAVLVSLPASATSYFDPAASGPVCYAVFPMGMNPQTKSDLVCGIIGYRSASGSPRSFALRLDQSNTATLTWVPPATGSPGGYMLFTLGGGTQTLGSGVTSMTTSANGPTCYLLGATSGGVLIGYTDILCGLPGFSNLS